MVMVILRPAAVRAGNLILEWMADAGGLIAWEIYMVELRIGMLVLRLYYLVLIWYCSFPLNMEIAPVNTSTPSENAMDVEMADGSQTKSSLKPFGGVGKKSQRVFKVGKRRRHGKGKGKGGKVKRRHI